VEEPWKNQRVSALVGKAVWFTASRTAEVREHQVRPPGPGEVTVAGTCSVISPGTEMLVYRGQVRPDQPTGVATVEGNFGFPIKYGYQVVGRVVEVGEGVELSKGTLVFARHPHQTFFTAPSGGGIVTVIPDDVDPLSASLANLLDTSMNCLFDVPVRFGDVVAVYGLGLVGLFCAQLASRTSSSVVGVDPVGFRRDLATSRGVPFTATLEEAPALIAELSEGRLADISFEASGTEQGLQAAILGTGMEGTIGVVAFYGQKHLDLVLSDAFHFRRQRVISSNVVNVSGELSHRWNRDRRFKVALRLTKDIDIPSLITHRFPIEKAADAYELVDRGDPGTLGVLLDHDGSWT
jgi:2-desacetyl-2-hydroxyethyl bacteriochlorophyllide A dehydrogenase